jgi:hypothetical protein
MALNQMTTLRDNEHTDVTCRFVRTARPSFAKETSDTYLAHPESCSMNTDWKGVLQRGARTCLRFTFCANLTNLRVHFVTHIH